MRRGSITIAVAAALVCVSSGVGRVNANNNNSNNDGWQELREILNNTLGVQGRNTQRLQTEAFVANLRGRNEVPPISTQGSGRVEMLLVADAGVIAFRLTYANLEGGPAPVTPGAAHVHFAPPRVNGGVSFFFCGGTTKPACPPQPAVVTGAVTMADIVGPAGQGIAAGEFAEIVAAMRTGFTYANVHTPTFGSGEIRGAVRRD
jgi:hypothetical protein